jgi:hypothetical protein
MRSAALPLPSRCGSPWPSEHSPARRGGPPPRPARGVTRTAAMRPAAVAA